MYRRVLPWLIAVFIIFLSNNPMFADAIENRAEENIKVLVFKIGHPNYYLEDRFGTVSENEMDTSPYIKSGRTFVPVRFLANALGIPDHSISWNPSTRAVTLTGNTAVHMVIGSKEMQSGGKTVVMDTAPEIIPPGRTMLPARYVAEGLGFKVAAEVIINSGSNEIVASITRGSVEDMGLKVGDNVTALIKASSVMVMK